jgi:hypothetical protein
VVYRKSTISLDEIVSLEYAVTAGKPELPTYQNMRWWQEGVKIQRKYQVLGITEFDIDFGQFMTDLNCGPHKLWQFAEIQT